MIALLQTQLELIFLLFYSFQLIDCTVASLFGDVG